MYFRDIDWAHYYYYIDQLTSLPSNWTSVTDQIHLHVLVLSLSLASVSRNFSCLISWPYRQRSIWSVLRLMQIHDNVLPTLQLLQCWAFSFEWLFNDRFFNDRDIKKERQVVPSQESDNLSIGPYKAGETLVFLQVSQAEFFGPVIV